MRFALSSSWRLLPLGLLPLLLSPIAGAQANEKPGFGNFFIAPRTVTLRRALPPAINANGRSVAVQVQPGVNGDVAAQLQASLEGFLTRSSSDVRVQRNHPDVEIECHPTAFVAPHTVSDNNNGLQTNTLEASIEISYRVTVPSLGRVLASDRYVASSSTPLSRSSDSPNKQVVIFGKKMQTGGPNTTKLSAQTPQEMQSSLVEDAARYIAAYIVSTPQLISVPLAQGGSLNEPDRLALAGLWSRDLESLEALTPFQTPRADAFRLYNMGVANEALGYGTQDLKAAEKYLSAASTDYGKAIDADPGEKQFIAAQSRIRTALAQLKALSSLSTEGSAKLPDAHTVPAATSAAAPPAVTNTDIIAMVQAHMDEGNIVDTIEHAPVVRFDISPQAQIALTRAGVNGRELLAMKQRARAAEAH